MTTITDRFFSLCLGDGTVALTRCATGETLQLVWPAVRVSIDGKEVRPRRPRGVPTATEDSISQGFSADGLEITVTLQLSGRQWVSKRVNIVAEKTLPTPDFVEVEQQILPADELRICGYRPTTPTTGAASDEEASGSGGGESYGYPLIGKRFFLGLEHPAGFSRLSGDTVSLRHHPVWAGTRLEHVNAVFGWSDNARETFADYLDAVRLPALPKPLVAFGTFWSDPYLGDNEYQVSLEAFRAFFRAFQKLGLRPDVFTLDAGWQERRSVFQAKKDVGGDAGLEDLRRLAERGGSGLSLWVSHNGPLGIDPEYMQQQLFEVGGGVASTYCGDGYGVMMDREFEAALAERFCELARTVGAKHFKIDWDNECATNASFDDVCPTRNHVREASLNAFSRIAREMRQAAPGVVTRNGWWPSPWWLCQVSHIWLSDSADSDYAALPSKTQRDGAATHRDVMYYNVLRRDKTPVPLDCFDNHEFPDAPRNPFPASPATWADITWLAFMRGSTYVACTLMPESLHDWQVESLKQIMQFCRCHAKSIFVARGRMVLGHPGRGEVYGFLHPGKGESWCVLRNPSPIPQTIHFDPTELAEHRVESVNQFYPFFEELAPAAGLTLLAHEVRIMILSSKHERLPCKQAFTVTREQGGFAYRFPASAEVTANVQPMVHPIQRIPAMQCLWAARTPHEGGHVYQWFVAVPFRTCETELQIRLKGDGADRVRLKAFSSRYQGAASGYALPITTITAGNPGYGERKNLDSQAPSGDIYRSIRVADGGQFNVALILEGMPDDGILLSVWLAGFQAPSRNASHRKRAPGRFAKCLPYQHPLGFGSALELPLPDLE